MKIITWIKKWYEIVILILLQSSAVFVCWVYLWWVIAIPFIIIFSLITWEEIKMEKDWCW